MVIMNFDMAIWFTKNYIFSRSTNLNSAMYQSNSAAHFYRHSWSKETFLTCKFFISRLPHKLNMISGIFDTVSETFLFIDNWTSLKFLRTPLKNFFFLKVRKHFDTSAWGDVYRIYKTNIGLKKHYKVWQKINIFTIDQWLSGPRPKQKSSVQNSRYLTRST